MRIIEYKEKKISFVGGLYWIYGKGFKTFKGAKGLIDRTETKFKAFVSRYDLPILKN